jgi:hypothetical protein
VGWQAFLVGRQVTYDGQPSTELTISRILDIKELGVRESSLNQCLTDLNLREAVNASILFIEPKELKSARKHQSRYSSCHWWVGCRHPTFYTQGVILTPRCHSHNPTLEVDTRPLCIALDLSLKMTDL